MQPYMVQTLLSCCREGTVVSVYSDKDAPEVFRVGVILGCDPKRTVLYCLDETGAISGIKLILTDNIYCVQYCDAYTQEIAAKWNGEIPIPTEVFEQESDAAKALLSYLQAHDQAVSVELHNSGTWDVSGTIFSIEADAVVLAAMDGDAADGWCVLRYDAITEISTGRR